MQEYQLKELAYTMFFGACGKRSNAELIQVMRAQLEVRLNHKHNKHVLTYKQSDCKAGDGACARPPLLLCIGSFGYAP